MPTPFTNIYDFHAFYDYLLFLYSFTNLYDFILSENLEGVKLLNCYCVKVLERADC